MKRFRHLVPLLLVWAVLGACVPVAAPIPEAGPSQQAAPEGGLVEDLSANSEYILLTGLLEDIRAVIELVNERNQETLDIGSLDNAANLITIDLEGDLSGVLFELFGVTPNADVEEPADLTIARIGVLPKDVDNPTLEAIEQVRRASTLLFQPPNNTITLPVYGELDLATALASFSIDPNSIGAHASGLPLGAGGSMDDFWKQWALGPAGIGLLSTPGEVTGHPGCVETSNSSFIAPQVVVFDTVPYTLTNEAPNPVEIPMGNGCVRNLDLAISAVVGSPTLSDTHKEYHGLFASALVHAVAPESKIELVRVLDSDGTGHIFDLLRGIMDKTNAVASAASWTPTIFNLSLGIHTDAEFTDQSWESASAAAQEFYEDVDIETAPFRQSHLIETDLELDTDEFLRPGTEFAVQLVTWATREAGILMVAASGNDAGGQQYPAAFVPVLGVGAYGLVNPPVKACYSNLADVYDPGGDSDAGTSACDAAVLEECDGPDCPHAVMSIIGWPDNWQPAFWSGTSFAAPLASGMVALKFYEFTNAPSTPETAVDDIVSQLQNTSICMIIEGRCKLDWGQVHNILLP